ncbi:hypothetical protein [Mycoplasma sp. P36-A1]|uniref:hypothetical protein n=1 Tax=Mycoplasma sp. P36-A1 TaxID=3252900 RepID=UPI003C2D98C1
MLNKKGFLSYEVLIVVALLAIITSLSTFQILNIEKAITENEEVNILHTRLVSARQQAINTKTTIEIIFHNKSIKIISDIDEEIVFNNIKFINSKNLYFNRNGNINQGYTILFENSGIQKKLIFYLGRGYFKIE